MREFVGRIRHRAGLILAGAALAALLAVMPVSAQETACGFTNVADTVLYVRDGVASDAAYHTAIYWQIPERVLQAFVADGYAIYIDDDSDACASFQRAIEIPAGTRLAAYYSYNDKYIYVLSGSNIRNEGAGIMHELGHYVDKYMGDGPVAAGVQYGSDTDEWRSIYADEHEAIGSITTEAAANVYSPLECYATAFNLYVLHPEELAQKAPRAYGYIEACVATF